MSLHGRRNANTIARSAVVCDITLPLFGRSQPMISHHPADLNDIYDTVGNLIEFTQEFDRPLLKLVTMKSAEAVCYAHSEGWVHGNLSPWAFGLTEQRISLLNIGLYAQAQQMQEYIHLGPAHGYKAQAELRIDGTVVPTPTMDIHSWSKTIIALYNHSPFKLSFGPTSSNPLTKPRNMPDGIWRVISQCLSEDLNIQVDMVHIIQQLAGAY